MVNSPIIDIEIVKKLICESLPEQEIRPLLLFRGGLTEGRARAVLNFLRASMLAEIPTMVEMGKLSSVLNDPAHYCGLHAKFGIQRMGMQSFFARVLQSPTVLDRFSGLEDYIYWVSENSRAWPIHLTPISETSLRSKHAWRKIQRQSSPAITEYYPFITGKPTSDHDLLLTVEALVPRSLQNETRADVCQDMIVAVLSGEVSLENLRDAVPKYVKQFFKQFPTKYGHISLDAPIFDNGKRTLAEVLSA